MEENITPDGFLLFCIIGELEGMVSQIDAFEAFPHTVEDMNVSL